MANLKKIPNKNVLFPNVCWHLANAFVQSDLQNKKKNEAIHTYALYSGLFCLS